MQPISAVLPLAHLLRSPAIDPLLRILSADFAVGVTAWECHSGNRLGEFAAALLFLLIAPTAWFVGQAS